MNTSKKDQETIPEDQKFLIPQTFLGDGGYEESKPSPDGNGGDSEHYKSKKALK